MPTVKQKTTVATKRPKQPKTTIGILAIHGSISEHAASLTKLKIQPREVRTPLDLLTLSGLIIPGGESTTFRKFLQQFNLQPALQQFASSGKPILGTCAGLILLVQLNLLPAKILRNAYGRQIDSFATKLKIPGLNPPTFPGIFIRAPQIQRTSAQILATHANSPVLIRQKNIFGATFHPELTTDPRLHQLIFQKFAQN